MEQQAIKKQAYVYPTIEAINLEIGNLMVEVRGDHNPIGQGGTFGDAPRWDSTEEEEQ